MISIGLELGSAGIVGGNNLKKAHIGSCSFAILCFIVTFIVICFAIVSLFRFYISPLTQEQVERHFARDYRLLAEMVQHLIDLGYERVHIREGGGVASISGVGHTIIEDAGVVRTINRLRRRGYSSISRNNNIVYFLRSTRFRNLGNGVVYSIDGVKPNYGVDPRHLLYGSVEMPTQIMFLTRLEPLSKSNWFYYEEDFREWRVRYGSNR